MATILVIDDERMLCDLLQEMLQRHGREVFTACLGSEGVTRYKERRPHFTILDLHLPDMSGSKCCAGCARRSTRAAS